MTSPSPYWPRWLSVNLAATYTGVSRNTFLREVDRGVWPQPDRRGGRVLWDKALLDRVSNQRSGLAVETVIPSDEEKELIRRAGEW